LQSEIEKNIPSCLIFFLNVPENEGNKRNENNAAFDDIGLSLQLRQAENKPPGLLIKYIAKPESGPCHSYFVFRS
jgi:hypothetical protein